MTLRSAYEHVVLLDEEQNPVGTLQKRVAHHEHTRGISRSQHGYSTPTATAC